MDLGFLKRVKSKKKKKNNNNNNSNNNNNKSTNMGSVPGPKVVIASES